MISLPLDQRLGQQLDFDFAPACDVVRSIGDDDAGLRVDLADRVLQLGRRARCGR